MAAKQPPEKNMDVMNIGTPRSVVLGELGQPVSSETNKDGQKVDVFSFTQGYGTGLKTGRAIFHGLADVATLGLWEVAGTPTEAVWSGTKVSYEVTYDENNKVCKCVPLSQDSKEKGPVQPIPASTSPELKPADNVIK
jgi:hypothetical protein